MIRKILFLERVDLSGMGVGLVLGRGCVFVMGLEKMGTQKTRCTVIQGENPFCLPLDPRMLTGTVLVVNMFGSLYNFTIIIVLPFGYKYLRKYLRCARYAPATASLLSHGCAHRVRCSGSHSYG